MTLSSIPRETLRTRLELQDDPEARKRTKIYPPAFGGTGAVTLEDRPAAVVMDSFEGATFAEVAARVRAHESASGEAMKVALRSSLALGAVGVGSLMGMASGVIPGPVGLVVGGVSLVGCVLAASRFETHEDAARDDARLLSEMDKAGQAILAQG